MNLIALTLALLAPSAPQATEIKFAPEPGTRLAKTVLVKRDLNLDEMGRTREGEGLIREDVGGWITAATRQKLIDEYLEVADGRPTLFRRTFSNFEGTTRMTMTGARGQQEHIAKFRSPIAGFPVLHTWIPEEQTWGRCYDYLAYDEEQLEELQDDADFLGLLPEGPVEPGASWDVSIEALRALLTPGGNSGAEPAEPGYFERMVEVGIGGDLADALGELSGVATVTFEELRQDQDRELAVLAVEFSLTSVRDRTRTYLIGMPEEEKREAAQLQQVLLTWIANGTAEVLWDLGAGHAVGASLVAQEIVSAEAFKLSAAESGEPTSIGQRQTYSGELRVDHTIKQAAEKDIFDPSAAASAAGPKRKGKRKRDK